MHTLKLIYSKYSTLPYLIPKKTLVKKKTILFILKEYKAFKLIYLFLFFSFFSFLILFFFITFFHSFSLFLFLYYPTPHIHKRNLSLLSLSLSRVSFSHIYFTQKKHHSLHIPCHFFSISLSSYLSLSKIFF